jgi:hypothetical protein
MIIASGVWEVLCSCFTSDNLASERLIGRGAVYTSNNDLEV